VEPARPDRHARNPGCGQRRNQHNPVAPDKPLPGIGQFAAEAEELPKAWRAMRDMLPGGILNRQPARRDVPNYLLAHTPRLSGLGKLFRTDCCSKSWISFEI
jgi:hypothetical protein